MKNYTLKIRLKGKLKTEFKESTKNTKRKFAWCFKHHANFLFTDRKKRKKMKVMK